MVSKKMLEKLLAHWSMENGPISNVYYEGSNQVNENEFQIGEDFVLKVSGLPGGLKRHMDMAEALDKVGLQASVPVATKTGELLVQESDIYAILCKRVQGIKMSGRKIFTSCDKKAAYRFGTLIGKLHQALAKLDAGLCEENRLQDTVQGWAIPAAQRKINLPQQLIHRNMNLSYVYLNGDEMAGVTDFEYRTSTLQS